MSQSISDIFQTLPIPQDALKAYDAGKEAVSQQRYQEATSCFSRALAFEDNPSFFEARTLEQRGICHWLVGNYEEAEADFQASFGASDDPHQQARARIRLGDVADSRGQYDEARTYYREALAKGVALNDLAISGQAHRGLGVVNRRRGNTEQALSHLTQALAALRQAGSAGEQGRVLISLGRTRHARGEYQQAITAQTQALQILEALQDRWRVVLCLNDLGECYQALYAVPDALEVHTRALQLADEHVYGINIIKPDIQRNLGVDLTESGRFEEGLAYLKQSLAGARKMGNQEQEALALYHLAHTYLRRNYLEEASEAVAALGEISEALDADRFRALCFFVRGELRFAQGEREAAVAELNEAMLTAQTSLDRGVLWKLHATMSHVVQDEALAGVHATIAADFVRQTAEPLQNVHLKESFLSAAPVVAVLEAAKVDPEKL